MNPLFLGYVRQCVLVFSFVYVFLFSYMLSVCALSCMCLYPYISIIQTFEFSSITLISQMLF